MSGDVLFKFQDIDVVVTVLVGVADGHVPDPKVSETSTDGPVSVVASVVFDDGDVTGFACWQVLVVGLERVVLLVNDDVNGVVTREFPDFNLFDVGLIVPVCVSALVASYPNVLAFVEVAVSVVVEDGHGVRPIGCNRHIVVAVAVKVPDGDVHGVAMGCVASCNRCTGRGGEGSGGAEHHQQRQKYTAHSGLREVVLG